MIRSIQTCDLLKTVTFVVAAILCPHAHAATVFNVNDNSDLIDDNVDDGICHTSASTCTLRAAIMQANHTDADTTINLQRASYNIGIAPVGDNGEESGDFNLTATSSTSVTTIIGLGLDNTAINGGQVDRVLHVGAGRHARITGVNITGGLTFTGNGGDILNEGVLEIDDSIVHSGGGTEGGAIYNADSLLLDHATVSSSGGQGGGIRNIASLTLIDSQVTNNNGHTAGGIWSSDGDTTQASVVAIRSLIDNNSGDVGGFCCSGDLLMVDSTVALNRSNSVGGGIVFNAESNRVNTAALYNISIVDNSAGTAGSGIASSGNILTLSNSLVARNYQGDSTISQDCSGTIASQGNTFFGSTDGCAVSGDPVILLNSLDLLGSLADNGGPTQTIALLAGSNAIDGGDPTGCLDAEGDPLLVDQRGFSRPAGAACDAGAFEFDGVDPDVIFRNGFESATR